MKFQTQKTTKTAVAQIMCDVLLIPVILTEEKKSATKKAVLPTLNAATKQIDTILNGAITQTVKTTGFTGGAGATFFLDVPTIAAQRVLLIGLGAENELTLEGVRRAYATALNAMTVVKPQQIVLLADALTIKDATPADVAQAITEGMQLASYRFYKYKKVEQKKWLESLPQTMTLVVDAKNQTAVKKGIVQGELTAQATITARDLINEPAVHVTPKALSDVARRIGKQSGVTVKIFGERDMKRLGMGALLAVAAGSDQEAQFIHLKYIPKKKTNKTKRIALCGKGITFDSGGLSLKPGNYMHGMHMDMAGAASILGLFSVITKLNIDVEVHGVIVATENMISGKATRPGDIVTAYDGTTIEITNTDAEGRLVLADALAWSVKNLKPDTVIDVATLTGAAIYALGQEVAAYFTNNEELHEQLKVAGERTGEQWWRMPLTEDYRPLVKSPVADLDNAPKTIWAGSAMGALFLEHFVKQTPWAHLDIAGPAMVEKQMMPYAPTGGSGFSVRTLIAYVMHNA
jgi:leucyl aminopeptidase